ncbi:MAG: PAS domain S-box protein [Anaerolineae bacterium]|nr:PAS domain S-box protein [Anaerolineae bacterium]
MINTISPDVLQRLQNVAHEKGISVDDLLGRWLDNHNTTLTRHVTDMISRHTPDGTYTYATPSATVLLGYLPDELVGRNAYEFFHPDDLKAIRQSHENIINRQEMQIVAYRIRHKDGHYIWFETTSRTVHDAKGNVIEIIAVSRDISQRKQTEAYLQGVLDSSPLGIMGFRAVRDEHGVITDFVWTLMNTHAEIMVSYKQADLLGKRLLEMMPGNKESGLFDKYVNVVETGNTLHLEQYYRYEHLDAWYHITAVKLDDGFVVTFADITIPKMAQEALRQSEAGYRVLFQEAPIAIWKRDFSAIKTYLRELVETKKIKNLESYLRKHPEEIRKCLRMVRTLDANHTALRTYGATSIEEVNAHFTQIAQVGEPQPASLAALLNATSYGGEFVNKKFDTGEDLYLLMKWIVIPGHEETFDEVLVVTVDITDQKKSQFYLMEQERLITQFRKEQEHNALIQRSISALAHDIRTPLAVVSTSKDLLLRYFDKLTEEKRREKLESIGRQLEFAIELIDDTVMTVRGELSKRPFRPTLTQLSKLCEVSITEVGNTYNARERLHFVNKAGISQVVVDDILVSRILMNLLSNAIKYSPNDTPIILELDKDETHLIVRVRDSGIGIPPEHLPHLFEPFYRVDENSPIQGTGLGLSIVKECVERHNGTIEVTSIPRVGTTFTVTLPYLACAAGIG